MRSSFVCILSFISIINCHCQTSEEYYAQGFSKFQHEDYLGAIADYNKAIELDPLYASAYQMRGISKNSLRDYQGGLTDLNKAIEIDSKVAGYYDNRGNSKTGLKDYIGAMADYNKAIDMSSIDSKVFSSQLTLANAYLDRANLKGKLEDYRGAIVDCTKTIEINPKYEIAYLSRGIFKISLGEKDSGCLDLSKAGELGFVGAYDVIKQYCK